MTKIIFLKSSLAYNKDKNSEKDLIQFLVYVSIFTKNRLNKGFHYKLHLLSKHLYYS